MKKLFLIKGFMPFLMVLFINATIDLGHKITIQNILVKSFDGSSLVILTALVNLLILLPYVGLFSITGFLNDKFSRTHISRTAAASEIVFTFFITIAYFKGWFYFAFFMTILLAIQSAIYSPAKYGLIKQIAKKENLGLANGVVEAFTIVAILASSLIFSFVFEKFSVVSDDPSKIMSSVWFIGVILFICSVTETLLSFKIPYFEAGSPRSRFEVRRYLKFIYLRRNLRGLFRDKNIFLPAFGLAIFWALSQLIIAVFPAHFKLISGEDNVVIIQLILAVSALGIVFGAMSAGAMSRRNIELGIVPFGALGLFISLLVFASSSSVNVLFIASMAFGFSGGLFIVPLNANIQFHANSKHLGRTIAASNFIQNSFMVLFLLITMGLSSLNITPKAIFITAGVSVFLCAILSFSLIPNLTLRILVKPFFHAFYKVKFSGLENIPKSGSALLVGNHISWIDWMLIQILIPRKINFVMHISFYKNWHISKIFDFLNVIPIGGVHSKTAFEKIAKKLNSGELVVIFPEGLMSVNSKMNDFMRGYEVALKGVSPKAEAKIIPFFIAGFWGSRFSKASKHYQKTSKGLRRVLALTVGEEMGLKSSPKDLKKAVQKLSYFALDEILKAKKPLHIEWLKRAKRELFKVSMVDFNGVEYRNFKVITAVLLFIKKLKFDEFKNVGVLLPTTPICSMINISLLAKVKTPINLNYTLSSEILKKCVINSGLKTIISSRKFIQKLELKGFVMDSEILSKVVFLEDFSISKKEKFFALLKAIFIPKILLEKLYFKGSSIDDNAFILYSSGSEGSPKGVMLSHKNILTNIHQIGELLHSPKSEVMLSSLPVFHSFGLTVSTMYPLVNGVKAVFLPDPTDAVMVGKLVFKYKATIIFGTSTFFRLYTKHKRVLPAMFRSIRFAVAGGEKLNLGVKESFKMKFGIDLLEGYGTTETSPVISVNLPNEIDKESFKERVFGKDGSVGTPLLGTIIKIVDDSLNELEAMKSGNILVGGHQVMMGYYNRLTDPTVEISDIRYYKTGDIGYLDESGFLFITGRLSRFAKIGGEMVSLSMVEDALKGLFSDDEYMALTNLEDEKKGEKIVLVYAGNRSEKEIKDAILNSNISPLMRPTEVYRVGAIPVLGSGKTDFLAVKNLAKELSGEI